MKKLFVCLGMLTLSACAGSTPDNAQRARLATFPSHRHRRKPSTTSRRDGRLSKISVLRRPWPRGEALRLRRQFRVGSCRARHGDPRRDGVKELEQAVTRASSLPEPSASTSKRCSVLRRRRSGQQHRTGRASPISLPMIGTRTTGLAARSTTRRKTRTRLWLMERRRR